MCDPRHLRRPDTLAETFVEVTKQLEVAAGAEANATFYGARMRDANFSHADSRWAVFYGADMRGANYSYADLSFANFYGADLNNANFEGAKISGAGFVGADLSNANLCGVRWDVPPDFSGADLDGAQCTQPR